MIWRDHSHVGTVLWPILFLIYIPANDFADYIKHSTLTLFADDTIIYKNINNLSAAHKLEQDIEAAVFGRTTDRQTDGLTTVKMTKSGIADNQGLWFIKEIIATVHHVSMDISPQLPSVLRIIVLFMSTADSDSAVTIDLDTYNYQTSKDSYEFSFYRRTVIQWSLLSIFMRQQQ
ncbi:hypothetical protein DPMN_082599 [Dreissena polymorpha]|uniref:Reverse transcriptase domain-containing protein n=1 Tax=Dreissena polymorpha TaxID=45954 RepID=A0A9D3Y777_DREPO|nr:hypothetical protein DPMN_082599 [Dreissena polymorpha]